MSRFWFGLFLVGLAWLVLGMTEYNENEVFTNPGIVTPIVTSVAQMRDMAAHQTAPMWPYLSPFKYGLAMLLVFMFPPFFMLVWREAGRLHNLIVAALVACCALDVFNMLQFNGNNSANGGYDGAGEIACYGLHLCLSGACLMLVAGRLLWCGARVLWRFGDS